MEKRSRILIFVNDPDDEKLFALFLQDRGFAVETARSPEDCLQMCKGSPPNLLLTSRLALIREPGLQFLRQLRADPDIPYFPILVGAADVAGGDPEFQDVFAAGANAAFGYVFDVRIVLKEMLILLENPQSTGISYDAIRLTSADWGYRPDVDR